jgi:hypothetical protein
MLAGWIQAAAILASLAGPQDQLTEARIPLRYSGVEKLLTTLSALRPTPLPQGLVSLRTDPASNELIVNGTTERIGEIAEVVRLLDVAPIRLRVRTKVFRVRGNGAKRSSELVSDSVAVTSNNTPTSAAFGDEMWDQAVSVLPRLAGDGTVALRVEIAFAVGKKEMSRFTEARRLKTGQTLAFTYATEANTIVRHLENGGGEMLEYPARPHYRVEVKVQDVLLPAAPKAPKE